MTAFTAYVLIPVYTFLFAINSDWFRTNFSVLGNIAGRKEAFVLWGLIVGIYFFFILRRIIRHMPRKPAASWLVYLLAAACLTVCLFLIVLRLYQTAEPENKTIYRLYLAGLAAIVLISGFLFVLAGIVSSALEIFFTVSATLMAYRLYLRVCPRP